MANEQNQHTELSIENNPNVVTREINSSFPVFKLIPTSNCNQADIIPGNKSNKFECKDNSRFLNIKKLRRFKRKATFNKTFNQFRENLSLKNCSRKLQFDSLLKKVKSKIFKTIYSSLKSCLRENYRLQRLPQTFIRDIKINSNKFFLSKNVKEIYQEFGIILNTQKLLEEDFIKEEKMHLFTEFLTLTFTDIYHIYMESKQYTRDVNKIIKKEGEKFSQLFKYIAVNFLDYYLISKGNKPKKKCEKNSKNIFKVIPSKKIRIKKLFKKESCTNHHS